MRSSTGHSLYFDHFQPNKNVDVLSRKTMFLFHWHWQHATVEKTISSDHPLKLKDLRRDNIPLRTGIFLASFAVGFAFPLAFLLAAVMAFALYSDLVSIARGESRPKSLEELSVEDNNWLERFHAACESPAETAFLDAMISKYSLTPSRGQLTGSGVKLELQVPVYSYRLDFLANKRLVIEIDGAAYHSSTEAIERDTKRDQYLHSKGYQVLRIPAKHPLFKPDFAISLVEGAIEELNRANANRTAKVKENLHPTNVWYAAKKGLSDFSDGLSKVTSEVHRKAEEQKEKDRIAVEMETERRMKAIQEELDADEELREIFEKLEREFK